MIMHFESEDISMGKFTLECVETIYPTLCGLKSFAIHNQHACC